ncbi:MAG TPA: TIGR03862 family flavoprotein [Burkholderiaceae bacterium]|nr:TIGR03862 family flavoprotein [Burkholderiaceae bacterium]
MHATDRSRAAPGEPPRAQPEVVVIGAGPAGLMAAEAASMAGLAVDVFDAMPSAGRKFLLAGRGGLNLTHSEPLDAFLSRYGERRAQLEPLIRGFGPAELRDWAHALGVQTFIGSSGRVFPAEMKAAPLLRRWLHRLREAGVRLHMRHRWLGWAAAAGEAASGSDAPRAAPALAMLGPQGEFTLHAQAVVLAMGGASWARLGSDAAWVPLLEARGVHIKRLRPANCGFDVGTPQQPGWSEHFRERFAGRPLKSVAASIEGAANAPAPRQGEFVVTDSGIEGSLVYAFSAALRDTIEAAGSATLLLDLAPSRSQARLATELARPRGGRTLANHLRVRAGLEGVKAGLLRELLPAQDFADPERLAAAIKGLPLRLVAARPIDEAISTAGGVAFESLDEHLMLRALPGVFCAGEMLDWEAPTGGYLLTACFATGRVAGSAAAAWCRGQAPVRAPNGPASRPGAVRAFAASGNARTDA